MQPLHLLIRLTQTNLAPSTGAFTFPMEKRSTSSTAISGRSVLLPVQTSAIFSLARDGEPSYQLACVVDDAAMQITEVVRGADLLKSTARQILLNRALGYADPTWFHCRLVTDAGGKRLAKRHDAFSIRTLREQGLSPGRGAEHERPAKRSL